MTGRFHSGATKIYYINIKKQDSVRTCGNNFFYPEIPLTLVGCNIQVFNLNEEAGTVNTAHPRVNTSKKYLYGNTNTLS
jgi:hypothetical protein